MKTVTTANIITMIRGFIQDYLKTDGHDAHQYDTDSSFQLSKDYVSEATIKVYKNGTLLTLTTDYVYNSSTNKVTITASLTKNDDIDITYSYYDKYSDTEILNFIRASLGYFVQHRYAKYFYINENDEIVTKNGVNPTVEEANIISLVTAINIDPKNITVKTRDFTISAEEVKSKSEQIRDVFSVWNRNFGDVYFLEEQNDLHN